MDDLVWVANPFFDARLPLRSVTDYAFHLAAAQNAAIP